MPMSELPSGTVTFLFTDIEGSTRLLKELRAGYADVLAEHQRLLRDAFAAAGGQEIDTQGDAFFVAFRRATDAVTAAIAAQRSLAAYAWPEGIAVRVRMGIHTGEPVVGTDRYVGLGVHRAARICAAARGGQILLSNATRELIEDDLPPDVRVGDVGEHRLKDIDRPERLFQVIADGLAGDFQPPEEPAARPPTPFAGREGELAEAAHALVRPGLAVRHIQWLLIAAIVVTAVVFAAVTLSGGGSEAEEPPIAISARSVGVINLRAASLVADIPVGAGPGAVVVGERAVWVGNVEDDTVSRIDPATRTVAKTIGIGGAPLDLSVGGGSVWVNADLGDGRARVVQIDADSSIVGATIELGAATEFQSSGIRQPRLRTTVLSLSADDESLWVTDAKRQTLFRIDVSTKKVAKKIRLDAPPSYTSPDVAAINPGLLNAVFGGLVAVAPDGDAIWVGAFSIDKNSSTVMRIDAASGHVVARVSLPGAVLSIAPTGDALWVAVSEGNSLWRIDKLENFAADRIPLGHRPSSIVATANDVWVLSSKDGVLLRVDPKTNTVIRTLRLGPGSAGQGDQFGPLDSIAVGAGALWVTRR